MADEERKQPSVRGQLEALLRQGAKDLHNAIVPAFPDGVRSQDEPGTPLAPTPRMVDQDLKQGYDTMLDGYSSRPQPEPSKEMER